jgi:hypothetical protein
LREKVYKKEWILMVLQAQHLSFQVLRGLFDKPWNEKCWKRDLVLFCLWEMVSDVMKGEMLEKK